MAILSEGLEVSVEHVPEELRQSHAPFADNGRDGDRPETTSDARGICTNGELVGADYRESRRRFEAHFLERNLQHNRGNVAATARSIGIHPVSLSKKIAQLGIDVDAIRRSS